MEIRPNKESQRAQAWILYLPSRGSLIEPVSGEGSRERSHRVQDQVEVALGSVGHNRNHSLQPQRNGQLVPAQALSCGQRQRPGRMLQQGGNGSKGEIKEVWSRARSSPPSPPGTGRGCSGCEHHLTWASDSSTGFVSWRNLSTCPWTCLRSRQAASTVPRALYRKN